jgi:hypothetical protein
METRELIKSKGETAKKIELKENFKIIIQILKHRLLTFSNLTATSKLNGTAAYLQI